MKSQTKLIKTLGLLASIAFINGCSTKYTCSEYPEAGCQPVSDVYESTNEGFNDYRKDLYKSKNNKDIEHDAKAIGINVKEAYRTLNYASPGDPILAKPVVMRVLLNTWIDKEDDLNSGGYLYIKVKDSEWLVN